MYPAAGVTPARPATAPFITAVVEAFFDLFHDKRIQTVADVAEAMWDTSKVFAAKLPDAKALPALKPNQPIHNNAAPKTANGIL